MFDLGACHVERNGDGHYLVSWRTARPGQRVAIYMSDNPDHYYTGKDLGTPVLGAGTLWAITNENEAAHDLIAFLQTPEAHEIWMARQGFLTPHKSVDPEKFSDPTLKKMNEILLGATTFRFDGSDLMPGGVGAWPFWTGMVDFSSGAKDAATVAKEIQDSWPAE